jgi:hypothetical protein
LGVGGEWRVEVWGLGVECLGLRMVWMALGLSERLSGYGSATSKMPSSSKREDAQQLETLLGSKKKKRKTLKG